MSPWERFLRWSTGRQIASPPATGWHPEDAFRSFPIASPGEIEAAWELARAYDPAKAREQVTDAIREYIREYAEAQRCLHEQSPVSAGQCQARSIPNQPVTCGKTPPGTQ